ncbi:uncharacterized protein LOC133522630 [Cydia pomonella]|uniref:uncharacterized protein LOC133522630 n=1 Tax=Cydia pomonella TaxID=82600 RepID=UPI002ADE589B|nr:uncharacterized protein LOC133522630 [Cydia pomonella]
MSLRDDESTSDDEVFFGKLSLKELKHMFCIHQNNGQTIATNEQLENDNHNMSLKLTHSEPDITSKHKGDASPENIPKSLSNTPLSPDQPNLFAIWDTSSMEFDNTLEEIEYILNNPPKAEKKNTDNNFHKEAELEGNQIPIQVNKEKVTLNAKPSAVVTSMKQVQKEKEVFAASSSVQHTKEKVTLNAKPSAVVTSMKQFQKEKEVFAASSSVQHTKEKVTLNAKPSAVVTSMKQVQKEKEVFAASSSVPHTKEKVTLNAKPSAVVTSMKQVQKEKEVFAASSSVPHTKEKVTLNAKPSAVVTSMKQVQKEKEVFAASSSVQHKKEKVTLNAKPSAVVTSMKQVQKEKEVFATSSSVRHTKPALCITPANPTVFKKPSPSTSKKTPRKNNAFLHIASPVAYYINNSPKIPLIQNVFPKKILRGLSSIPKLVKSSVSKPSNKENVNLPSVAYKSAKKNHCD